MLVARWKSSKILSEDERRKPWIGLENQETSSGGKEAADYVRVKDAHLLLPNTSEE